ncbi:S41 family peptidase [Segeticoccus rhizosphaerae]|uniref:S41 family peptidase n=1 Tax=Segeticoccus rhizosphaerae TaxID=1104777 RepID=UPI00126443A9|nr:S41 family peptidase [Segeticoccus rhizosphaerae]
MTAHSYLRFPHVRGEQLAFVAEDDIWVTSRDGGRAYRVSADQVPARSPRLSPDGRLVAWTAARNQSSEVYIAPTDGGTSTQLTYWGQDHTRVCGWLSDTEVLVVSTTGEADRPRSFAHAVPVDGSPSRRLPLGWAHDLALHPVDGLAGGALLSTTTTVEPAWWKHYRGGTAAQLWLDRDGSGDFTRLLSGLESSLVSPLWTTTEDGRTRIGFISDHDGRGQVYSALLGKRRNPGVASLERHTDHELYARHASGDGRQVVYVSGGELYLLDSLAPGSEPRRIDVRLGGARVGLAPKVVETTAGKLETISTDRTARASAIETRGRIIWLTHRDGPARALADASTVRRRLPAVLGDTGRVAWVTDADGDDAVEVGRVDGTSTERLIGPGKAGRVLELAASPDGKRVALATHDGRLLVVEVPTEPISRTARLKQVDTTTQGDLSGLAFSPDSRWLAWSAPGAEPLRQIRMVEIGRARATAFDVTPLRFTDTEPTFTRDGKHLAFLSVRSLDPVYDAVVFDLSFPRGCRPHLVPLEATTPSPFAPLVGGRPLEKPTDEGGPDSEKRDQDGAAQPTPPTTTVDREGLHQRIVPTPVEGARYSDLRAVAGGLVWRKEPLHGELGSDLPHVDDDQPRATLEHLDLTTGTVQTLAEAADGIQVSGDGTRLVVSDGDTLRVLPATRKVEDDAPERVEVDLDRVRVRVEPAAEWTQMFHEAWRLMRDHFWRADMNGVDWDGARDRYAALLPRLATHDDLVDLIWELQGELGSSHAYCTPPSEPGEEGSRQGLLGADLAYERGAWRVQRVIPGESSEPRARSPLAAPGVAVRAGDVILAVDGRETSATRSPGSLLLGASNKPVELTIQPADGGAVRAAVVVPTADEFPLRYQDWANGRRDYVHARTNGAVGYVHIPDMVSGGWAQLHRDLRTEVGRDALIVDVRGNRGGHISELIIEKLARRIIGWSTVRGYEPMSYPGDARRGPMVAVTDMHAGSDGDIVTAAIRALELGPVIGTRTWGGVIGIDGRYTLVDGTKVTQPRYSFWFQRFGWGVENHGVDPDIEVPVAPQDHVAGRDVQLDRAIAQVQRLLARTPALKPPAIPPLP